MHVTRQSRVQALPTRGLTSDDLHSPGCWSLRSLCMQDSARLPVSPCVKATAGRGSKPSSEKAGRAVRPQQDVSCHTPLQPSPPLPSPPATSGESPGSAQPRARQSSKREGQARLQQMRPRARATLVHAHPRRAPLEKQQHSSTHRITDPRIASDRGTSPCVTHPHGERHRHARGRGAPAGTGILCHLLPCRLRAAGPASRCRLHPSPILCVHGEPAPTSLSCVGVGQCRR